METTLIVGGGIFGVSTAYHLARRIPDPSRITLLDRAPPPSKTAASTDINKIIRADYSSPLYMQLGLEAIDAWNSLPFFKDAGVYHQSGWIAMDEKTSHVSQRIRDNFRACGLDDLIVDLTEDQVRTRWGGVLRETDCRGFGSEAVKLGVDYQVGEARRVVMGDGRVQGVETRDGRLYTADKVLLATGAWTSQFMSSLEDELGLQEANRVESQVSAAGVCVAHFNLSDAEKEAYSQLPVVVYGEQGEVIPPNAAGVLKCTFSTSFKNTIHTPSGHAISVPTDQDQLLAPRGLQEESRSKIKPRLPQILENDRKPDYYRICWDSITPSQHPLITRHPESRLANLYLAVGGSFHCYKFLPTIGKYVANMLLGVSNSQEKDEAWAWKDAHGDNREGRGVHDSLVPTQEWRDFL